MRLTCFKRLLLWHFPGFLKVLKGKKKNIALSLNRWWNSFKGLWHRNWCIYTFFAVANWKFLKLKWPCLKIATEHNWTMHCNFPLVWNDIVLFLLGHDHRARQQQQLLCTHAVIIIDNNDEFQLKPLVKHIHELNECEGPRRTGKHKYFSDSVFLQFIFYFR